MRTLRSLFPFIIALLIFAGCTDNSDELINSSTPTSRSATASSTFKFNPAYVATAPEGPYEDVNRYLMMSTGHYLVSDHFFLRCIVENKSDNNVIFNPNLMEISLGNSSSSIAVSLKDANFNNMSSVTIPTKGKITVHFELPYSFMYERINIDIPSLNPSLYYVTNIHFYYDSEEQECPLYNFLFSTHAEQNRN